MLLRPSVIERFVLSVEATVSGPTRRTLRTNLRYVAARLRSTWLAAVAEGIGLRAFMDAAGRSEVFTFGFYLVLCWRFGGTTAS